MKKIFLFLALISTSAYSQRQIDDGTKILKSDAIYLISEIYRTHFVYVNDFFNTVTTSSAGNDVQATNSGTGAATSAQSTDNSGRPGLVRSTTGTTATGRTSVSTSSAIVRFGGGTWVYEQSFNITTTSTSVERYQLAIGFIDAVTAANQVDAAYLLYDEGGVSTGSTATGNWQAVTSSNSTRTFTPTSTAVIQGTWTTIRIEVNAAGTQVVFKVNGNTVATHTTNIPVGAGRETGFGWLLIKSVGTTARTMDCDYISAISQLTTPR